MANTKISALTANTNPNGSEELVYAYNNANGKMTLNTMKSFIGGAGITTLSSDANIWELSDGFYETTYDLYYKSGSKTPAIASGGTKKQMLFVTSDGTTKGYFVFGAGTRNGNYSEKASFGYSTSSSIGSNKELRQWDASFSQYSTLTNTGSIDALSKDCITQVISDVTGAQTLQISPNGVYSGVTYTIVISSIVDTYDFALGTGVTNPMNIERTPGARCIMTLLATSDSTAIISGYVKYHTV